MNTQGGTATYQAELTEVADSPPPLTQPVLYAAKWQSWIPYSIEVGMDYSESRG